MRTPTAPADTGHRTPSKIVDGPRIRDVATGPWQFVTIEVAQDRYAIENVDAELSAAQTVCRAAQAGCDAPGTGWIVDGVEADTDIVCDLHILRFTFRRRPSRLALLRRRLGR